MKQHIIDRIQSLGSQFDGEICSEVDLHIHTQFSDGLFPLEDILEFAERLKLKHICITDHNTILNSFNKAKELDVKNLFSGVLHFGSEIACKYYDTYYQVNQPIEILAYNIKDVERLESFLQYYESKKTSENHPLKHLLSICDKVGLRYSSDIAVPVGMYATECLMHDLKKYPDNKKYFSNEMIVWDSPKLFFKKFCTNPNSDFYLDTTIDLPSAKEVVDLIHELGGLCFIAHPYLYIYSNQSDVLRMIGDVQKCAALDGVEVYHSNQISSQSNSLLEYCSENNLLISGGTDFHNGRETLLGVGDIHRLMSLKEKYFLWLEN